MTEKFSFPNIHRSVWGLIILSIILSVGLVQAESLHRVGLVVVHGDQVIKQCIVFPEDTLTGYEVLERSGLDFNADLSNSMGAAICRIDNHGCTYPADDCFCQCQGTPCSFWSYWHLDGGTWRFSGLGTSNYEVGDGDVEGWVWGEGTPNRGGSPPPALTFEEICVPKPTDTPTFTPPPPTEIPTPTCTPIPTDTPEPTATFTPVPTPVISHFAADRASIAAGENVVLSWNLTGAKAAYLRYDGIEEGVVAPGSKTVTPAITTVYTLIARNDGGETKTEITITVTPAAPAAANTVAVSPTIPVATIPAVPTLPPAATSVSLVITNSAAIALPTAPPLPTSTAAPPPVSGPTAILSPAPASPPVTAAATSITQLRPIRLQPHRNRTAAQPADGRLDGTGGLAVLIGVIALLGLFVVAPVALLGLGGLAWWLRRRA